MVPVAARIERLDSMSAHADAGEIMRWLSGFVAAAAMTYLVHGEPAALEALRARIEAERGWPVHVAKYLEKVELPIGTPRESSTASRGDRSRPSRPARLTMTE